MNTDYIDEINALCDQTSALMNVLIDAYGACQEENIPRHSRDTLCNLFGQVQSNVDQAKALADKMWQASTEARA